MSDGGLRSGQVAAAAGVNVQTVQRLAFTLNEVAELLEAGRHRHRGQRGGLQPRAAGELAEVEAKMADLTVIRDATRRAARSAGRWLRRPDHLCRHRLLSAGRSTCSPSRSLVLTQALTYRAAAAKAFAGQAGGLAARAASAGPTNTAVLRTYVFLQVAFATPCRVRHDRQSATGRGPRHTVLAGVGGTGLPVGLVPGDGSDRGGAALNMVDGYLMAAAAAVDLLEEPSVHRAWDQPSALHDYLVSGLAGHLAGQVSVVRKVLEGPEPAGSPVSGVEYLANARWLHAPLDGAVHAGIRDSGAQYAADGPKTLAARTRQDLDYLRDRLPTESANRVVEFPRGPPSLVLTDLLTNRAMELVVHCDDLAVSTTVPTPDIPVGVAAAVVDLLIGVSFSRHGTLAVVRALTRTERAPCGIAAF